MKWLRVTAAAGGIVAACLSVATSMPAVARPAVPFPANRVTLTAATQHLRSSTGRHLGLELTATQGLLTMQVTRRGTPETHTWTFVLPTNSIEYDDDGTGFVRTGTSVQPFGRVSLAITATARSKTVGCGRTRSSVTPVTLRGVLRFGTRSTGPNRWGGVVEPASYTFSGHSTIAVAIPADKLCPSFLPPCVTTTQWEAHNIASDGRGYTQLIGLTTTTGSTTRSTLTATRLSYLAVPSGATRTDVTSVSLPNPDFTTAPGTAAVAVRPGTPDPSGSARLAGTAENQMPALACGTAGPGGTRTVRTEWQGAYRNGAAPLTISQQIEGAFRLRNVAGESSRANATIDRIVTTTGP